MRRRWSINYGNIIGSSWNIYNLGTVVDLTVSEWGARCMLKPEDLGFSTVPEMVQLGHKRLMKHEYISKISSISQKAACYLMLHSFPFPFGNVRFLPSTMVSEVTDKMAEYKAEFDQAVDEFVTNYETYHQEMLPIWNGIFEELLLKADGFVSPQKKQILLQKLDSKYPSRQKIRAKYNFDFSVFEISPPRVGDHQGRLNEYGSRQNIAAQKISERLDGFLDDVLARLQQTVLKTTANIKSRLEDGSLGGQTIQSFVRFADSFHKMDLIGLGVEEELVALRDKLLGAQKDELKNNKDFTEQLQKSLTEIEAKVLDSSRLRNIECEVEE